jgi:hypothetical protein
MRGRPFSQGRSGNPGGRPKIVADVRDLARQHAPGAIKELARLCLKARSEAVRVAAIKELLDRGYGRAVQFGLGSGGDEGDSGTLTVIVRGGLPDCDPLDDAAPENSSPPVAPSA